MKIKATVGCASLLCEWLISIAKTIIGVRYSLETKTDSCASDENILANYFWKTG